MQNTKDRSTRYDDLNFFWHPVTSSDQAAMTAMRAMVEPNKGRLRGVAARLPFDEIIRRVATSEGVTFSQDIVGGVSGWWCTPQNARSGEAVLHLHGGWFNWGTAQAFQKLVGHIAKSAAAAAFIPEYRLAPEHPFPAAGDDVLATYRGLVERGLRIAVTGDSAGGNLALELMASTAGQQDSPVAVVVLSPVTDLTLAGPSWDTRAATDPFFVREQAQSLVDAYLNGHDPADPLASPLFRTQAGLVPLRIHVGNEEVLLDDALRLGEKAREGGVDVQVHVWEGMAHGFLSGVGRMDASTGALEAISAFLNERLTATSRPLR